MSLFTGCCAVLW